MGLRRVGGCNGHLWPPAGSEEEEEGIQRLHDLTEPRREVKVTLILSVD